MTRMMARLSALAAATGGVSAVEFGLIAAFLILPLTVGLYDFGTGLYRWMEVGNAARAGAQYANVSGHWGAYTTSGKTCPGDNFTCAVQGATNLGTAVAAKAGKSYCGCQSGTTFIAQSFAPPCNTCGSFTSTGCCPTGQIPVTMGRITATYNFKPLFHYLGLGPTNGITISAQATALIF